MKKVNKKKTFYNRLVLAAFCFLLVLSLTFIERDRLSLWKKGYSLASQNVILNLNEEEKRSYLDSYAKIDFQKWNTIKNNHHYYDYAYIQSNRLFSKKEKIVQYVDAFYKIYPKLKTMGYSLDICRTLMKNGYTTVDFKSLAGTNIQYAQAKPYLNINGSIPDDLKAYVKSKKKPLRAVLSISHQQIDSSKKIKRTYLIPHPDSYTVLVKKGYKISKKYTPADLVKVKIPAAHKSNKMRKAAAKALEKMYADAKKKDLHLMINSAYRSYASQESIYDEYHQAYDQMTADSLVAIPGCSEHQLGLGVDITSKTVVDGEYGTFGQTSEYKWMQKNAYKYGYILRYPDNKTDITGTANEPWHFRYVGKKPAAIMKKEHLTLEEYTMKYGFHSAVIKK